MIGVTNSLSENELLRSEILHFVPICFAFHTMFLMVKLLLYSQGYYLDE